MALGVKTQFRKLESFPPLPSPLGPLVLLIFSSRLARQVWPIYDMILYAYVPTAHRPLFNSFMSIAWGGYLSHVSQPHEEDEHGEDIAEATS